MDSETWRGMSRDAQDAAVERLRGLTEAEMGALVKARRAALDATMAAGDLKAPKPLTYSQPRGPSIRGGPEGWTKETP